VGNADPATLSGLGTIVVKFWEAELLVFEEVVISHDTEATKKKAIAEKVKKALLTHSVK